MTLRASIPVLTYSIIAAAAIKANQLVGWDNAPAGADEPVQGVAQSDAAEGEAVTLTVIGLVDLTAGDAIDEGDALISDVDGLPTPALTAAPADGQAPAVAASTNPFARALNGATPGGRVTALIR